VLVFVLKKNLPEGGGQAAALAKTLDRWVQESRPRTFPQWARRRGLCEHLVWVIGHLQRDSRLALSAGRASGRSFFRCGFGAGMAFSSEGGGFGEIRGLWPGRARPGRWSWMAWLRDHGR
jgi:hypothetical protein